MLPRWTTSRINTMCEMLAQGRSGTAIARSLGTTRNAVRGLIARMEKAGDPRLPPERPRNRGSQRQPNVRAEIDALAEHVANGALTIAAAGRAIGITQPRADQHWLTIRRELGPQAR